MTLKCKIKEMMQIIGQREMSFDDEEEEEEEEESDDKNIDPELEIKEIGTIEEVAL